MEHTNITEGFSFNGASVLERKMEVETHFFSRISQAYSEATLEKSARFCAHQLIARPANLVCFLGSTN